MYHEDRPAETLTECTLTEPLRMPPNIAREVRKSSSLGPGGPVLDYTVSSAPAPADGVPVRVVYHTEDHAAGSPADCEKCGGLVARVLTRELRVGETVPGVCVCFVSVCCVFLCCVCVCVCVFVSVL